MERHLQIVVDAVAAFPRPANLEGGIPSHIVVAA
jgi:hypothetical protein